MKEIYQTLSRKYRPQNFQTITGQEAIVKTLKNALRLKRVSHAYLFCGSRGTGKTTLARVFAKALHCSNIQEDQEPCNHCESCQNISLGRSLDILEIDGASHRGIDDIRQINETVAYAASSGKYKIYIIDEVHMLTKEAFNALLKTLEEPPEKVVFFFATTEPHKVPATILSRCQRFDLHRLSMESIVEKLSRIAKDLEITVDVDGLKLIAHAAEGSLRDAESLFDQLICYAENNLSVELIRTHLGSLPKETFFSLDKAIHEENYSFALELTETIFSSGKDLGYFVEELLEHFRLILITKLHPKDSSLHFLSKKDLEQYQKNASLYTKEQCIYFLDFLLNFLQEAQKTPFKRITLEALILHLIQNRNRISLPALIQKLSILEKSLQRDAKETALQEPVLTHSPQQEETLQEDNKNVQDAATKVEILLSKQEEKIVIVETVKEAEPVTPPPKENKRDPKQLNKYETLLRFAAVELEGTINKDPRN
ncbi:MAG: DNA polymerase III subunit gamma/tau [Chlamydiae bacterium]|nr:DNA polymerase III subunit gamma/tau [Chlamydiota bacterium]